MDRQGIIDRRLSSQRIANPPFDNAHDVVHWMGAMQAQDYQGALWSIGLRMKRGTIADVEKAIQERKIVRSWPMRGTLHFMAAEDARWMIHLLAPRVTKAATSRRAGLGIDKSTLTKTKEVLIKELSGKPPLSRPELFQQLEAHGIATANQRGIHLLHYFAEQALLCFGLHEGKQPTFTLMEEWLPATPEISKEEALARLAERYFTSHGPATLQDFAGWSGLTLTDARAGLATISDLTRETIDGTEYIYSPSSITSVTHPSAFLLPGFDEYMLGYKNRSAALESTHADKIVPGGNGMFLATIVIDGRIVGTWKRTTRSKSQIVTLIPFTSLSHDAVSEIHAAARRYEQFIGVPVTIREATPGEPLTTA